MTSSARGARPTSYRIEVTLPTPSLRLSQPNFAQNDTHRRQHISVPKGGRYATIFNVRRSGAGGELDFDLPDLPAGLKVIPQGKWQNGIASMPVIIEAAPRRPHRRETGDPPSHPAGRETGRRWPRPQFDYITGPPGYTVFYKLNTNLTPVSVVEEAPFSIAIQKPSTAVVRSGRISLKVVATRKEGFTAPIKLYMLWRPAGVSSANEVTIPEGKTEGVFNMDCNGNAAEGDWKLTVLGEASHGGHVVFNATPFEVLKVEPSYLAGKVQMNSVTQGQEVDVTVDLTPARPFEGEATAVLNGIPGKATSEPVKFTKDTTQITFKVKTEANTPPGTHKGLFCSATIPTPGGTIPQTIAGGGVLRVDKPKPPEEPAPAPGKAPPAKVADSKPAGS